MASPRVSRLLSTDEELEGEDDGRTPLDRTIDKIGMGTYQWALLSLCGFGWAADNMWLQAIAIILPRVQDHYVVSDSLIGAVSACMFAGMMIGAIGWGTCSDLLGRSSAFNLTLCFTALFGIVSSLVNGFPLLCVALFFLGTAVGGSMPTDGTLLLESLPRGKQYLLTFLSIFFSVGAVLAALFAIIVIPPNSCPGRVKDGKPCDVEVDNTGWRILLRILGFVTLGMFICRILIFRLHESPRYLVSAGRKQEAVLALKKIAKFNGEELPSLNIDDVDDVPTPLYPTDATGARGSGNLAPGNLRTSTLYSDPGKTTFPTSSAYQSTETSLTPPFQGEDFNTPVMENPQELPPYGGSQVPPANAAILQEDGYEDDEDADEATARTILRPGGGAARRFRSLSTASTASDYKRRSYLMRVLPRWIRRPLQAWSERLESLFTPEWKKTTLLMWMIWLSLSTAFTIFNVFLPKQLEARQREAAQLSARDDSSPPSLEGTMWEVVVFTLGGCPGSVLGAYLIETPLGRRKTLALSTLFTASFCILFAIVRAKLWIMIAEVGVSLSATTMWAVLYGMTPEYFATEVRGTAVGSASALSRVGGIMAPLLGGPLLAISPGVPIYTSVVIFLIAVVGILALDDVAGGTPGEGYQPVVH